MPHIKSSLSFRASSDMRSWNGSGNGWRSNSKAKTHFLTKNVFAVYVNYVNSADMKSKNALRSPILELEITKENYDRAVIASSGACLIADDIKEKYPGFTNVEVNVATIRISDKAAGVRYIYLTPRAVGDALLHFDQGWTENELPMKFVIKKAVRILPIIRSKADMKATAERRKMRLKELETKEKSGEELTRDEKVVLTKLKNPKQPVPRPSGYGHATAEGTANNNVVIRGGTPPKSAHNPNLLAGRTRHFGAKTAKPSVVFEEAVEQAVKERMEEAAAREEQQSILSEVTAS
jgi:hypothetical protein